MAREGIDGFRLDVINYISKRQGLPDGNKQIGEMMHYYGIEHYFYGPHLHDYLREMREQTFGKYDVMTVGETPGVGIEMSKQLTAKERKELDMVFSFAHLESSGHSRFDVYEYDLNYLKNYFIKWMKDYGNNCWMSLFYENHDNPRMISKVNQHPEYRVVLGKLLAMIQLTLKGTPFIFQGQELGMINKAFTQIEDFKDIESLNLYAELIQKMPEQMAFQKILSGSRDHGRSTMPWDDTENGGFTTGKPWIKGDEDYKVFNAKSQMAQENSIYYFYKTLIAMRKANEALIYGEITFVNEKQKNVLTYYRKSAEKCFYIECNLSSKFVRRKQSSKGYKRILCNYRGENKQLRPYEATLYICINKPTN
nr:alpha-amylase family glycosyl hydrolase [Cellulosilyticum ruminicola]